MKELNEIQFDHENIILNSNKVKGSRKILSSKVPYMVIKLRSKAVMLR